MASRLRREGLFLSVGEPRVVRGSRDDRVGIELEVEEGPANTLFGVLGYNPRPEGGGDVVGQVDFQLRNIVGTARRAASCSKPMTRFGPKPTVFISRPS